MSRGPGRFVARKDIPLPRPRDLEVTYTGEFSDIVLELRGHIGAVRTPQAAARGAEVAP
jgi:NitT/TauT family transport system ATP-binding protein